MSIDYWSPIHISRITSHSLNCCMIAFGRLLLIASPPITHHPDWFMVETQGDTEFKGALYTNSWSPSETLTGPPPPPPPTPTRSYNISTDIIIQLDKACRRPVRCFENAKDTTRKTRPSDKSGHGSVYLRWTHQYHPQPSNLKRQDADNNAIHNYFGNAKFYAVCFLIGFTWDYRHHHRSIFVLLHNLNFKMAT